MATTSITWQNERANSLREDIRDEEHRIRSFEFIISEAVAYNKAAQEELQIWLDLLNCYNSNSEKYQDYNVDTRYLVHSVLNNKKELRETEISNNDARITSSTNSINDSKAHIALLRERLAVQESTNEQNVLLLSELKEQLKPFACINPHSIKIKENGGAPFIQFTMKNILSKVDISNLNGHPYIESDFADIYIPIPPVVCTVYPIDGSINMKAARGTKKYSAYCWDGQNTVHPHVLVNKPCLGDFNGPVREAVDEKDWSLVVTLLKLFLERIISDDSAGEYWPSYFKRPLSGRYCYISREYFYADGAPFKVKQHKEPGYYTFINQHGGPNIEHPHNAYYFPHLTSEVSAEVIENKAENNIEQSTPQVDLFSPTNAYSEVALPFFRAAAIS